jgi:hypothetical protein
MRSRGKVEQKNKLDLTVPGFDINSVRGRGAEKDTEFASRKQ